MRLVSLLLATVAAVAADAAASSTWIVDQDGGPNVDFTSLSLAVDVAAEGDILLVRESVAPYPPLTVDGKALTIRAEPETAGARPVVPTVLVRDLAAGQTVVVSGFAVEAPALVLEAGVAVRQCAGAVFLEDLAVAPASAFLARVMEVVDSPRVVGTRLELIAPPSHAAVNAVHGLSVHSSSVALYDCRIEGADGAEGGVGAHGVVLSPGTLLLAGCVVEGGRGGDGAIASGACSPAGNGGDGLHLVEGTLTRLDSVVTAGAAGAPAPGCPASGVAGVDVRVLGGSVTTIADTLRQIGRAS
ncbi:MAG: hypothetical protein ACF8XB_09280, partial [Planctomycetota bacterium JB042]